MKYYVPNKRSLENLRNQLDILCGAALLLNLPMEPMNKIIAFRQKLNKQTLEFTGEYLEEIIKAQVAVYACRLDSEGNPIKGNDVLNSAMFACGHSYTSVTNWAGRQGHSNGSMAT